MEEGNTPTQQKNLECSGLNQKLEKNVGNMSYIWARELLSSMLRWADEIVKSCIDLMIVFLFAFSLELNQFYLLSGSPPNE
jgi:hypothetical protein